MKKRFDPSRRRFLQAAVFGAAASPWIIPRHVLSAPSRPGANDTVNAAIVGLGGRARLMYTNCIKPVPGLRVVAVCDFFKPKLDRFMKDPVRDDKVNPYEDHLEMIDKEKLDAVFVETTTQTRARVSIHCMQAGIHPYIEKSMSLTVREGRLMCDAAKKYGVVAQVGLQQRSLPLPAWASRRIREGVIGKVKTVIAPNFVGPWKWISNQQQPQPSGGKEGWWDRWLDQAAWHDYHGRLFYDWSRWWDFDGGGFSFGVAGWGTHSFDQVNAVLGTDHTGPTEIVLEEEPRFEASGRFTPIRYSEENREDDDTGKEYYGLAKAEGTRAKMRMTFENGAELRLHLDGDRGPGLGCIVVGEKGKIEVNRHKLASNPRELIMEAPTNDRDESIYHVENWIDCIRSGQQPTCDIETGQRGMTLCHLVNIVREVGKVGEPLLWDPKTETFTNSPEGNKLLSREPRKGYELPEI